MQITVIGLLLGIALLLVPIYFFQAYGLRLLGRTLSACAMMVAKFAVVGAVLYFLFLWNNIVSNILFTIVAVVLTAAAVVVKARLSLRHSFVPLLAGVAVAVVTVGALCCNDGQQSVYLSTSHTCRRFALWSHS